MTQSVTVPIGAFTEGMTPVHARARLVRRLIGCSVGPIRPCFSIARRWHWLRASLTRSACWMPCFSPSCSVLTAENRLWLLLQLQAAEALAAEQRLGFNFEPRFLRGAILSAQGAHEEGSACLRDGLASRLGGMRFRVYGLARLADALVRQGEHGAALAATREGRKAQEEAGHRQWEAEVHRLEGDSLLGLNRLEEGQIALKEALRIARKQQAGPMSFAPRQVSLGYGVNKAAAPRRA